MIYPLHPDFPKPPYPELSPCPWCGRENFRHDLTKHVDPSLGTPMDDRRTTRAEGK